MYTTLVNKKNKPKLTIIKSSKKGEKKKCICELAYAQQTVIKEECLVDNSKLPQT